jgi:hypothetical protein
MNVSRVGSQWGGRGGRIARGSPRGVCGMAERTIGRQEGRAAVAGVPDRAGGDSVPPHDARIGCRSLRRRLVRDVAGRDHAVDIGRKTVFGRIDSVGFHGIRRILPRRDAERLVTPAHG